MFTRRWRDRSSTPASIGIAHAIQARVPVKQMIVKTTDKSRGIRLGNFVQIRDVIDEELENVWSGKKDAKAALDSAVARSNDLVTRFARTAKE